MSLLWTPCARCNKPTAQGYLVNGKGYCRDCFDACSSRLLRDMARQAVADRAARRIVINTLYIVAALLTLGVVGGMDAGTIEPFAPISFVPLLPVVVAGLLKLGGDR